MKLTDVPEDFRSKFILQVEQIDHRKTAFIAPTKDCNGHSMPHMALVLKGLYPNDIVKLKHPNTGEEFIVRRTEVMTKSAIEIVHEWEMQEFRKEIDQVRHTENMHQAAHIWNLPPGGAVTAKLRKAERLGILTPGWFKPA